MDRDIMKEIANKFKCPSACIHEFQDKRYGKGYRIFNTTHADNKDVSSSIENIR